jgi:hypothetical protein
MVQDSFEVRRVYLENKGNALETAKALGISRQLVDYHVRRANELRPLTVPTVEVHTTGTDAERSAVGAFVRAQLERVGILKEPPGNEGSE